MTRKDWWTLLKETGGGWVADKVPRLAAALAFYTILSVAPLLVIALSIVGMIYGRAAVEGQLVEQMRGMVGDEGAKAIQSMIAAAAAPAPAWRWRLALSCCCSALPASLQSCKTP